MEITAGGQPVPIVTQETHYDPWGLELSGIGPGKRFLQCAGERGALLEDCASAVQRRRGAHRRLWPQLGRIGGAHVRSATGQVPRCGPAGRDVPGHTPVQFGANSPVVLNGPGGLCPDCKTWGDVLRAIHESTAAAGVYIKNGDGSSYTHSWAKLIGGQR